MRYIKSLFLIFITLVCINIDADIYHETKNYEPIGYCCYREGGFYNGQNGIRWDSDFANEWPRYGVTNESKVSFPDLSEQSLTSGFERASYNTPK